MFDDIVDVLKSGVTGDLLEDEVYLDDQGDYDVDIVDQERLARLSRELYLADDLTEREHRLIEAFLEAIKPVLVVLNVVITSRQTVVKDYGTVRARLSRYE